MDKNYNSYMHLCIGLFAALKCSNAHHYKKPHLPLVEATAITQETLTHTMDTTHQYPLCINIETADAIKMAFEQIPKIRYMDTEFFFKNDDHTILIFPQTAENYVILDNEKFSLKQFHFHAPGKHTVNGLSADMELHIVHESQNGNIAVFGVFLQSGEENKILTEIFEEFNDNSKNQNSILLKNKINLRNLIPYKTRIFRYQESPAASAYPTERQWILCERSISLSPEQIELFATYFDDYSWSIPMPDGDRQIFYY